MAPTEEVIAVADALRAAGGMYVTHMRDEAEGVLTSIEETLRIGREVGVPVVISHHKCAMPENYGRSVETLPFIEAAAAKQKVDFDVYPYACRLDGADARAGARGREGENHLVDPAPRTGRVVCWPTSPPTGGWACARRPKS